MKRDSLLQTNACDSSSSLLQNRVRNLKSNCILIKHATSWAVDVALLEEQSLLTPEKCNWNSVINNFIYYQLNLINFIEKQKILKDFTNCDQDLKLLVATTVIEVGIDVPDATIILIENAENFGLSQLHQLRGRVGRSEKKSFCILLYGEKFGINQRIHNV